MRLWEASGCFVPLRHFSQISHIRAVYQTGAETKAVGSVLSPTGSVAASTITSKAAMTTIGGGSIESGIKSIVSGITHNGGYNMQKGMAIYAIEGILGVIAALLL